MRIPPSCWRIQIEDPLRDVAASASGVGNSRRGGETGGKGTKLMGLRYSRHEARVVGATWSSDPEDCYFFRGKVRATA